MHLRLCMYASVYVFANDVFENQIFTQIKCKRLSQAIPARAERQKISFDTCSRSTSLSAKMAPRFRIPLLHAPNPMPTPQHLQPLWRRTKNEDKFLLGEGSGVHRINKTLFPNSPIWSE